MEKQDNSITKNKNQTEKIITQAGFLAEKYGLTRISGELAALLFLEPEPLPIGEMSQILQVSKPSVSTNIRFLERWRVVKKVPVRNDRRDFYEFSDDLWEAAAEAFKSVFQTDARAMLETLESGAEESGLENQRVSARLTEAVEIFRAIDQLASALFARRESKQIPIREIPIE